MTEHSELGQKGIFKMEELKGKVAAMELLCILVACPEYLFLFPTWQQRIAFCASHNLVSVGLHGLYKLLLGFSVWQ